MTDFILQVVEIVIKPLVIFAILLSAFFFFKKLKRKQLSLFFLITASLWFFIITVSPLPQWLMYKLETRYPVVKPDLFKGKTPHILILGGGHVVSSSLPPTHQLNLAALSRLVEGIRLYQEIPGSKLVYSGGSQSKRTTQAELLGSAGDALGVSPADTIMIRMPLNTGQEAFEYYRRFGNKHELILVTSAFHMPRAMLHFERKGLSPIPAITHEFIKFDENGGNFDFIPSLQKVRLSEIVLHEYAALVYLKLF